jgi:site-specific DNA recombinase
MTNPQPARCVDEGVFEQAQAQLRRNVALHAGRPPARFYLLRGLLRCGLCGRRYSSNIANGKRQYRCTGQDKMKSVERCKAKPLSADVAERETWGTVVSMLKRPDLMVQKMEAHRVTLGARDVEVRSEAEHLAKQLAEVERQEQKALDLYFVADDLTADVVNVRLGEIQKRKAGLAERLTAARERIARHEAEEARQDGIRQACQQALRGIDRLDEERRRQLLVTLVDRVVVGTDYTFEIYGFIPTMPALTPAPWSARSLEEAKNGQSPWMIWPPLSSKLL